MTKLLLAPLAALALFSAACDKAPASDAAMNNELRAPGAAAPVGKGGIPDDSIKPAAPALKPVAPIAPAGRGGVPDDSVKPAAPALKPVAPIAPVGKNGVPDDSVKPATLGKSGVPDDSVKPAVPVKRP